MVLLFCLFLFKLCDGGQREGVCVWNLIAEVCV